MKSTVKSGVTVLTLLTLVRKIFSLVYKIPYQNLTSDAGFYVFQQIYPIIALLMLLTSFVLPTIIASLLEKFHYHNFVKDRIKKQLWFFSLLAFILLFLGYDVVARLMGDRQLGIIIRITGIHFLFIPPVAYMRGVFLSKPDGTKELGYSLVIEQMVRVIAILIALDIFRVGSYSYYQIAMWAFLFSLAAPIIAIFHLMIMTPVDDSQSFLPLTEKIKFWPRAMFLTTTAGILVLFSLVDSFLMFNILVTTHAAPQAMQLRGIYERGLPILQAGTFFVSAITTVTITKFENATTDKQRKSSFSKGFFYMMVLAVPATIGLRIVMPYLNVALFTNTAGTNTLEIMMWQVLLYAILVLLTAILTRTKKDSHVLATLLVGIFIKLILTSPLINRFGITGAAISSNISLIVMVAIMIYSIKHLYTTRLIAIIIGISIATFVMNISIRYVIPTFVHLDADTRNANIWILFLYTILGIVIFVLSILSLVFLFKLIGNIILRNHKNNKKKAGIAKRSVVTNLKSTNLKPKNTVNTITKPNLKKATKKVAKPSKYNISTNNDYRKSQFNNGGTRMRLDKFLKVSRIIKRRQTAKEVSDAGKIAVNGKIAKSSTALSVGDEITLFYATRTLTIRVLELKDSTKKEDAERMFEIVREEAVKSRQ